MNVAKTNKALEINNKKYSNENFKLTSEIQLSFLNKLKEKIYKTTLNLENAENVVVGDDLKTYALCLCKVYDLFDTYRIFNDFKIKDDIAKIYKIITGYVNYGCIDCDFYFNKLLKFLTDKKEITMYPATVLKNGIEIRQFEVIKYHFE
ncbi:hypothetical protein CWO85_01730 [Candidatus Phytoplasma ziziphi]|uniref:Uncharacterized protein n=1 Tax=Ziziphus jujuba witches'-broom phytoplasma TaxID=135727 RepID=A0A660HMI5_ZIZJU|nr:hypothetical protein [Candidatus Phytoplasma ziziphi]AYJ01243.1 hypothetical protein CWO85_01730 [Candidatus Phytoplasma ziziphi]